MSSIYIAENLLGRTFSGKEIVMMYENYGHKEGRFYNGGTTNKIMNAVNATNNILAHYGSDASIALSNNSDNAIYSYIQGSNTQGNEHWALGNGQGQVIKDPYLPAWMDNGVPQTYWYVEVNN